MTTQQITRTDKSVITDSQVTELQTPIDSVSAIVDPWQNLNAAITGIESLIDDNDTRNLDDGETNTDMEINTLVTNSNNETPLLNTASDPIPFVSADFTLVENDVNPLEDPVDSTTNSDNSVEAIDNATDAAIEPTVKPDEITMVDSTSNEIQIDDPLTDAVISDAPSSLEDQVNSADDGVTNISNGSEVIDNPNIVADIGNEIQIDAPLAGAVDVSDGSIMGGLVTLNGLDVANEPRGIDNGNLDGSNTDLLTNGIADSLTEDTATIADTDSVDFVVFSPNEIEATSGGDIDLNSMESGDSVTTDETQPTLFSGDAMTAPDDVFSNSHIPVSGRFIFFGDSDALLTNTVDVSDDSIMGGLNMMNEPYGIDEHQEWIEKNSHHWTEDSFTLADISIAKLLRFSSREVQFALENNVNLNFVEPGDSVFTDGMPVTQFTADTVTTPNNDVSSSSDISVFEWFTPESITDRINSIVRGLNPEFFANSIISLPEGDSTFTDTNTVDNEIEATSSDVDLNSVESRDSVSADETQPTPFSADTMAAPDDDVFSNSDISMPETLTSNEDSDAPLTDTVDVTDDSITESLDITDEALEIDNSDLDGLIKNNTDSFTDSIVGNLTEVTSTIADTDTVDLAEFSSNEVEATSGGDVDLNSNFMELGDSVTTDETQPTLFSGDNMTTPDDDVFFASNPDIPVFETLSYSADNNSPFIQLIGNSEDSNGEG